MVKCLTQEHNMLVTAGFEPGLRANSFIHCATHAHQGRYHSCSSVLQHPLRNKLHYTEPYINRRNWYLFHSTRGKTDNNHFI